MRIKNERQTAHYQFVRRRDEFKRQLERIGQIRD